MPIPATAAPLPAPTASPAPSTSGKTDKRFLTPDKQALVVACLTDGNGVRGTGRIAEVDKNTVMSLGLRVGTGCHALHNALVRNVRALVVQGDETWSFIHKKEARVTVADPAEWGDAYTFIAIDAITKLVIAYHVGKRCAEDADVFAGDLRARLTVVPHLTTDGFNAYPDVIAKHFDGGGSVDFGTAVKHYTHGAQRGPDHRYEPPRDPFVTKHNIFGSCDEALISTAYVERYNLTQRHIVGRTRRLCLAFSKTLRGHVAAIALGIMAYNFVRPHSALGKKVTPAMAAGLTDHVWTIAELTAAALAAEPCDAPEAQPLTMPAERAGRVVGASRPLPNGRGFLRAVSSESAPTASPSPAPTPAAPAAPAPAVEASTTSAAPPIAPRPLSRRIQADDRQLSLLFGIEIDPKKGGV